MTDSIVRSYPRGKPFTICAVLLLELVAMAHLLRFFAGWELSFNGQLVPLWASLVAAVAVAGLAVMVWVEASTPHREAER